MSCPTSVQVEVERLLGAANEENMSYKYARAP
jgi:hypothetical protein